MSGRFKSEHQVSWSRAAETVASRDNNNVKMNLKGNNINLTHSRLRIGPKAEQTNPRDAMKGRLLKMASVIGIFKVFLLIFISLSYFNSITGPKIKKCTPYFIMTIMSLTGLVS